MRDRDWELLADVGARRQRQAAPVDTTATLPRAFLALQRSVGNAAVTALLSGRSDGPVPVQRCGPTPCDCPPEERAKHEEAPGHEKTVQRSVDTPAAPRIDRAAVLVLRQAVSAVRGPCPDTEIRPHPLVKRTSVSPAVREAQRKLNLFKTTNSETPLVPDCIFGQKTFDLTVEFQKAQFPDDSREWDGKIGNKTWAALDSFTPTPVPPTPTPLPTPPTAQLVATANAARQGFLTFAIPTVQSLIAGVDAGLDPAALRASFGPTVRAVQRWLLTRPENADFKATLQQAVTLMSGNLTASSGITSPPASDAFCAIAPCAVNGFGCTNTSVGVNVCQGWVTANPDCERDVLLHEFYHFIGLHRERSDRASASTPADALDNADTMSEFVVELNGAPTDRCSAP